MSGTDFYIAWLWFFAVVSAIGGGMAELLHSMGDKPLSKTTILRKIFVSGFIGHLTLMAALEFNLSVNYIGFLAGIAGTTPWVVLEAYRQICFRVFKTEPKGEKQ